MKFALHLILFGLVISCEMAWAKDLLCETWNMKWFPSGRADMRRDNFFEETITADNASKLIGDIYREVVTTNDCDVLFFAQEMRDREWCARLVEKSGIPDLKIATVSDFRDNAGVTLWQQTAILTTLPVVDSGFDAWKGDENVDVPRGYSWAVLRADRAELLACFCIHLKSNLNIKHSPVETQRNIYKREISAPQILNKLRTLQIAHGHLITKVVVAGDFNTNEDEKDFVSESTLRAFYGAHFRNCLSGAKKADRVTHPGNGAFSDATFDYILYRGFAKQVSRRIFPGGLVSDHNIVTARLR